MTTRRTNNENDSIDISETTIINIDIGFDELSLHQDHAETLRRTIHDCLALNTDITNAVDTTYIRVTYTTHESCWLCDQGFDDLLYISYDGVLDKHQNLYACFECAEKFAATLDRYVRENADELLAKELVGSFSPSSSDDAITVEEDAATIADVLLAHRKSKGRDAGYKLKGGKVTKKDPRRQWDFMTISAAEVIRELDLDVPPRHMQLEKDEEWLRVERNNLIRELLSAEEVEVTASKGSRVSGSTKRTVQLAFTEGDDL